MAQVPVLRLLDNIAFRNFGAVIERQQQVAVRLGEIGFQAQGLVIAGHGFIQPSHAQQRLAEIVMGLGVIGPDGERLLKASHGLIQLA